MTQLGTQSASRTAIAELLARAPIVLAPMEDVTDAVYRRLCRTLGAVVCVTEFVRAEQMIASSKLARRKTAMDQDDRPTAIQIYGPDAGLLLRAAIAAAALRPTFLDINCGCWVPRVVAGGAGAGWLRDPVAMVAMAKQVVAAVDLPVTVKTRIGWGPESHMPIVELAKRLEDVGVAGLTIHCRTAQMGHSGSADWNWARRAREVVSIPVVVNGDIRSAEDAMRALKETGCAGAMIGRAAIDYPWIFRETRALLDGAAPIAPPTDEERIAVFRELLKGNVAARGETFGVRVTRRHSGLLGERLLSVIKPALNVAATIDAVNDVLDGRAWQAAC